MVCREYRLSSVLIAQVRTASWLDDPQIQSLFHTMRHDPLVLNERGETPTHWQRSAVFDRVVNAARSDIDNNPMWRPNRRAGLRARLESELDSARATMPDDTLSALDRLQLAANESQRQLRARLQMLAARRGMSEREITEEFNHLRANPLRRGRQDRATNAELLDLGLIPADPRTRYALNTLRDAPPRRQPVREVDRWYPVTPDTTQSNPVVEIGVSSVSDRIETRRLNGDIAAWRAPEEVQRTLMDSAAGGQISTAQARAACTVPETSRYAGYRHRCDACGQFVGVRPHECVSGRRCEIPVSRARVDGAQVSLPDPITLHSTFASDPTLRVMATPAVVEFPGCTVQGTVGVRRGDDAVHSSRGRNTSDLDLDDAGLSDTLNCSICHTGDCEHAGIARTMLRRRLELAGTRPTEEVQARARTAVLDLLAQRQASQDTATPTSTIPTSTDPTPADPTPADPTPTTTPRVHLGTASIHLADDPEAFRRFALEGDGGPVMFSTEAGQLRGLAAGTRFGVELEFDGSLTRTARDLVSVGTLRSDSVHQYHAAQYQGWQDWSLERDGSTAGELVSPIFADTAEDWQRLETACRGLRMNAGLDNSGSHTNISCDDYTPQDAWRLVNIFRAHEADLFRMGRSRGVRRDLQYTQQLAYPGSHQWSDPNSARYASGYAMINFQDAFAARGRSRLEYRFPDASHDPGIIQGQVKLCAALTNLARREDSMGTWMGTHQSWTEVSPGRGGTDLLRVTDADNFAERTLGIRRLIDTMFDNDEDRRHIAQLWGRGRHTHRR